MEHMDKLFKDYEQPKKTKIRSERALVISDIIEVANATQGIKKKLTPKNTAVLLSPFNTPDLYVLLSKMKQAKTPAATFWYFVKSSKE